MVEASFFLFLTANAVRACQKAGGGRRSLGVLCGRFSRTLGWRERNGETSDYTSKI
jgi:hypothetical protein